MDITGVIAEYNPFHNGHAYQLKRAKQETAADYLIVVMSGNFVQRGAPALLDKFTRAKMALSEGADLVIELPPLWSTASAEYFACAGVALLEQLGCVNHLCYGCETPDLGQFTEICGLLSQEPPKYRRLLMDFQKEGASYALAREKAVLALLPEASKDAVSKILRSPNNILAIEYQRAAASSMKMHPIQRAGQGYHSQNLSSPFASASAIRRLLANGPAHAGQTPLTKGHAHATQALPANEPIYAAPTLCMCMPPAAYCLLCSYHSRYPFLYEDDFSQMLHYCLIQNAVQGFSGYADCTSGFSNKICRNLDGYAGFTDFCALLKSKDIAYARISRVLLHILLDMQQDSYLFWRSHSYVPYARVLGFCKKSASLLSHLKKHSSIPLLTRAADAKKILTEGESLAFFEKSLFADSVYRAAATQKGGRAMPNEYRQQIIIA